MQLSHPWSGRGPLQVPIMDSLPCGGAVPEAKPVPTDGHGRLLLGHIVLQRKKKKPPGPGPDVKVKNLLDPLLEMQKHLGKKRRHSGDNGGHSKKEKAGSEKQRPQESPSLDQLRAERLRREAAERARAEALLARVRGGAPQEQQPEEEAEDRRRGYNSQFNPQLARRPRWQDPPLAH
ncbi:leukocyte receptor cluster member 1-like [Pteronotus mesoamericanus]|uniref:leukocyte receptor cluster member 1-like n=1 Tax=Pteronotus mesoamericanus TaxID=1884717 RepID=UPI0023EAC556|nr:leukocyte receptor cluster member 1-like [Pteronotus parnellii mesoamericanus]